MLQVRLTDLVTFFFNENPHKCIFSQAYYWDRDFNSPIPLRTLSIKNNKKVNYNSYQNNYQIPFDFCTSRFYPRNFTTSLLRKPSVSGVFSTSITPLCFTFLLTAKEISLIQVMTMMLFIFPFFPLPPIRCLYFVPHFYRFSYKFWSNQQII